MSFIYLASPYTPRHGESVEERVRAAAIATCRLMEETGHPVFSPIVHSHALCEYLPDRLRFDHDFWMEQDLPILSRASRLCVLRIPGWTYSAGVRKEILFAQRQNIPVQLLPVGFHERDKEAVGGEA